VNMNIARRLPEFAKIHPGRTAVTCAKNLKPNSSGVFQYDSLSFFALEKRSLLYANKIKETGLKKGDRVLIFIRPSLDFSAVTFAVFRLGLVPVFIDPGMGRKNLLEAVSHIKPVGLIAEPEVHFIRLIFSQAFKTIKVFVTTKGLTWGKMQSLKKWREKQTSTEGLPYIMEEMKASDTAAILFTSGGTGIPKGVRYTHGIFNAQVEKLKEMFQLGPEEIDLPGFPLFSLFTITMGMKSAIAAMNPSKPAQCNPEWLVQNILDHQATFVAGSPAIWKRVADYCLKEGITLPSVKYVVMFGAPVPLKLHEDFQKILPNGDTHTPYGATECLPVANISGKEILNSFKEKMNQGLGTCVGKAAPQTIIKIAPITDDVLAKEQDIEWLPTGHLGEVCILSETVTPEYVDMKEKTAEAKIVASQNKEQKEHEGQRPHLWHRMGDLGYLDEDGHLWFCGRKSHRVTIGDKVIPSVPQEGPFLNHPLINKVAFVGPKLNGEVSPSMVIEPLKKLSSQEKKSLSEELMTKYSQSHKDMPLQRIYFHSQFPVDVRHNIKIDRLKLKTMIEEGSIR
jgi:acyl-CoA synthetase (AMP-forming)/AMP-acid ligase II